MHVYVAWGQSPGSFAELQVPAANPCGRDSTGIWGGWQCVGSHISLQPEGFKQNCQMIPHLKNASFLCES